MGLELCFEVGVTREDLRSGLAADATVFGQVHDAAHLHGERVERIEQGASAGVGRPVEGQTDAVSPEPEMLRIATGCL